MYVQRVKLSHSRKFFFILQPPRVYRKWILQYCYSTMDSLQVKKILAPYRSWSIKRRAKTKMWKDIIWGLTTISCSLQTPKFRRLNIWRIISTVKDWTMTWGAQKTSWKRTRAPPHLKTTRTPQGQQTHLHGATVHPMGVSLHHRPIKMTRRNALVKVQLRTRILWKIVSQTTSLANQIL